MTKKTIRISRNASHAVSNPFEYTRPIIAPSKAIKRDDTIQQVITHVQRGEYISILEPRQTGKTTFLSQARSALEKALPDSCVVYIDFESLHEADFKSLVQYLASRVCDTCQDLSLPEEPVDNMRFITLLREWAKVRRCVFLIDELPSARALAFEFLVAIRAYFQEGFLEEHGNIHQFVIAGSADLAYFSRDMNPNVSPFNFAIDLYLGDFTQGKAAAFIRRLAKGRFTDDSIKKIVEYTNGHPFLVQYVCHHLWDLSPQERAQRLKDLRILLEEIKLEDSVNIQSMMDQIRADAEHSQQGITLLRKVLQGERIPFSLSHKTVRNLVLQGGIVNQGGLCAIRNPIYEAVFKKNFAINDKIEPSLSGRGAQLERRPYEDYFKKLKNFNGWITVSLWEGNKPLPYDKEENRYKLHGDSQYELRVVITKGIEKPKIEGIVEELTIRDGADATDEIRYSVRPESFYSFDYGEEQTRVFPPSVAELMETYRFPLTTHELTLDEVQLFVNIYQDISLVQTLRLSVQGETPNE
jgi:hypothetical protein